MKYEVKISRQAESDLRGIYEYIAFCLLSPNNARGQIVRLERSIMNLERMPERFKQYDKEPWRSLGMRQMPVDNFVVMYIPNTEESVVTILRVMYGGRDIDAELGK